MATTNSTPAEPPPPYTSSAPPSTNTNHLAVPGTRNGIPPSTRRSMEDENRPLPPGWIRQFDINEHHQFFVDTNSTPPRSIWSHPYDDETYLSSLTTEERESVEGLHNPLHRRMSGRDLEAESSADDEGHHAPHPAAEGGAQGRGNGNGNGNGSKGVGKLGRKIKDSLTASTHEERVTRRKQREEEERRAYEIHSRLRTAMVKAERTGEPQLLGRDREGKEVWIEPSYYGRGGGGMGGGMGGDLVEVEDIPVVGMDIIPTHQACMRVRTLGS